MIVCKKCKNESESELYEPYCIDCGLKSEYCSFCGEPLTGTKRIANLNGEYYCKKCTKKKIGDVKKL